ncbi:hypothetical protein SBA7_320011 [Candidatus Sulfotelmatobacter sp. SbA7]|nr:hypothetical protein SBA7_320011 [Candidatus Sulfotelmatobacter sp. SbA7]
MLSWDPPKFIRWSCAGRSRQKAELQGLPRIATGGWKTSRYRRDWDVNGKAAPPDGAVDTLKSAASTRAGANWVSVDASKLIPVLIIALCKLRRNPQLAMTFSDRLQHKSNPERVISRLIPL